MSLHPQADVAATYVEDFSPGGDDEPNFNEARDAAYGPQTDSFDSTTYASNTTPETYGMPAANELLNTASADSDQQEGGLGNVLEHFGAGIGDQVTNHTGELLTTAASGVAILGGVAVAAALAPAVTTLALIGGGAFAAYKLGEWAFGIADDVAVAWDPNAHSATEIAEAESNLRGSGAGFAHIVAGSAGGLVAGSVKSAITSAGRSAVSALDNGALRGLSGIGDDIFGVGDDALAAAAKATPGVGDDALAAAAKATPGVGDDALAAAGKTTADDTIAANAAASEAVTAGKTWFTPIVNKVREYTIPLGRANRTAAQQAGEDIGAVFGKYGPWFQAYKDAGGKIVRDLTGVGRTVGASARGAVDTVGTKVNQGFAAVSTKVDEGLAAASSKVDEGVAAVSARLKPKAKPDEAKPAAVADDAKPTTVADGAKPNLWADIFSGKKFVDAGNELAGGARNIARVSRVADESFASLTTPALKYAQAPENAWRVGLIPGTVGATFAYDKSKTSYFDGDNAVATTALHDGGQVKVLGNIVDDSGQPTAALIQNARGETYYAVVEGDDIIARPFALNGHDDPSNYPHIAWANQFSYVDVPANMRVSMI